MSVIPEKYKDILEKVALAHVATINEDGTPQSTPVWFQWDGTHVEINSAKGRKKDRNMRANPQVAMSIVDPENAYRYLEIRGEVVTITEDGADESIDALTKRYLQKDKYPFRQPGEVRVRYLIEPRHCTFMG